MTLDNYFSAWSFIRMRLQEYLDREELSHEEFARTVNTSQSTISQIARGRTVPHKDTMWRIAYHTRFCVMPSDYYPEIEAAARSHHGK
jgi:transcriptional regulator with XRE-family HTH domain